MWEKINEKFKKYPARIRVAEKMIELGLSLNDDGKIYCGNLKISDKALATATDVDRRVIKSTINVIKEDEELYNLFNNIIPAGTLLKNIAKNLELGVIEIEVGSKSKAAAISHNFLLWEIPDTIVFLCSKLICFHFFITSPFTIRKHTNIISPHLYQVFNKKRKFK